MTDSDSQSICSDLNISESEGNTTEFEIQNPTSQVVEHDGDQSTNESRFELESLDIFSQHSSDKDQGESKDQSEAPSNLRSLFVTEKGSLKWRSDYEGLCHVVEQLQLQPGKWTIPRGQCKQFANSDVVICWYINSGTLTIKGNKATEIKEKLLYFDNNSSDKVITDSVSSKYSNLHSTLKSQDSNLHIGSRNSLPNNETLRSNVYNPSVNPNETNYTHNSEIHEIKSNMECFANSVNRKLEVISNEISSIKEFKAYSILSLEEVVSDLNKEKLVLSNKNDKLEKENKDLCVSLSELRAKVLDLQDEKASLLTAMKLIQREGKDESEENKKRIEALETENNNLRDEKLGFTRVMKRKKKTATISSPEATSSLKVKNQFEVLSSKQEDEEEIYETKVKSSTFSQKEISDNNNITSKDPRSQNESTSSQPDSSSNNPTHHTTAKSSSDSPILIIGDSIIKHIDPKKISRKKTIKRTFPGKTAEQIKSEVESMEVEVLPSHIIVHAGTNDLSVQPSHNCVKNIENLALCIKKKFTDSRIAISSITVRNDLDLSKQISTANEELQKMCSKNGFDFIKNNNIDATCLNGGLLHLNSKGSAFLATNFIKFLRGNIPAASEYRQRKRGEDFQGRRTYQNHSLEDLLRLLLAQRTEY